MTSVLGSVSSWLVGVRDPSPERPLKEDDSERLAPVVTQEISKSPSSPSGAKDETATGADGEQQDEGGNEEEKEKAFLGSHDVDLQEVSEKAMHAAKEWGSYLFNFGKAATEQVAKTAKQLKETVEEKTLLGDFSREQEKFVSTNREKKKFSEAAVAPWVGYNEEEVMKTQILALSKDKRNLLRNPPAGVAFNFDYESSFPIAMVMLDEDPNLKALRFELVPKQIKEDLFWRNYFYRVSLIKQSTQLTSLAQQRGGGGGGGGETRSVNPSTEENMSGKMRSFVVGGDEKEGEELVVGSPPTENEFVSDTFQSNDVIDEDLKKEMHQLGMTDAMQQQQQLDSETDDIPEWEKELQAELQEYEVVSDEDADLEREIMNQIEAESKQT